MEDTIRETLERLGVEDHPSVDQGTVIQERLPRARTRRPGRQSGENGACLKGFYFCNGAGTVRACQYCRTADLHDCLVMPGANLSLLGEKGHAALKGGEAWRNWKRENCTQHNHDENGKVTA